jgi:hypothetical protein
MVCDGFSRDKQYIEEKIVTAFLNVFFSGTKVTPVYSSTCSTTKDTKKNAISLDMVFFGQCAKLDDQLIDPEIRGFGSIAITVSFP